MATISHYNHTANLLLSADVNSASVWSVVLLSSSAIFDATDTTLNDATNTGAWEVHGNGWTQGGETITNVAGAVANTDEGELTADDLEVQITGGDLGPFSFYLICVDGVPLSFVTLTAPKTVPNGYIAHIPWTDGVLYSSAMSA